MRIRNGGWLIVPAAMMTDLGLHYELDVRILRRRVYKSSIDKEFEFGFVVGTGFALLWCAWSVVRFFLWGILRTLSLMRPRG